MKAADLNVEIPAWILRGSRAQGPFPISEIGQDHAVLAVPNDFRLWTDAERVKSSRFTDMEIVPITLLTQSAEDAKLWNDRNEPHVGDLVAVKVRVRDKQRKLRDSTITGVVYRTTEHQVQIIETETRHRGRHFTKDSCVVLVKGASEDLGQE